MPDTIELASAVISLGISTDQVGKGIVKSVKGVAGQVPGIGKTAGRGFAAEFSKGSAGATRQAEADQEALAAAVDSAARKVKAARQGEEAAARQVAIEEAKLQETRDRAGVKQSQILAGEDRLEKARIKHALATDKAAGETRALEKAQAGLQSELAETEDATDKVRRSFGQRIKGISKGQNPFKAVPGMADDAGRQSAKKLDDGLSAGVKSSKLSGLGGALKAGIVGVVAGAGLAAGAVFTDSIGLASDLGETMSKSSAIFGDQAGELDKWGNQAATSFGLTKSEALASAASFGDMFRQIGFTGKEAATSSKDIVQMAADLGSFNNLETGDVLDKISGAMRGEYDSLQAIIPNISAARVEQEALAASGKKSAKELTAQEKAMAVQAIIAKDGARAMGDFARTSGGLANQQKILSAQTETLKTRLGQALMPAALGVVGILNRNLTPAFDAVVGVAGSVFDKLGLVRDLLVSGDFTGGFSKAFNVEEDAPIVGVLFGVREASQQIVTGWQMHLIPAGQKVIGAFQGLWAVVAPIIGQVQAAFLREWPKISPVVGGIFTSIRDIVSGVMGIVQGTIERVTQVVSFIWERWGDHITGLLMNAVTTIVNIFGGLFKVVSGIVNTLAGVLTGDWGRAKDGLVKITSGLWQVIKALFTGAATQMRIIVSGLWQGIKGLFSAGWTWVKGTFAGWWAGATELVAKPIRSARDSLKSAWSTIRGYFSLAWTWVKDTFARSWAGLKSIVTTPLGQARDTVKTILTAVKDRFTTAVENIGKVWDGLKAKLKAPISFGIQVINEGLIGSYNELADWLPGLKTRGPIVIPGFRHGVTEVPGRFDRQHRDNVLATTGRGLLRVEPGEAITPRDATRRSYGLLEAIRTGRLHDGLLPAFRTGGVAPVPGRGNRHTSGYPWASWAGDYPQPTGTPVRAVEDGVVALVRSLTTSYGKHIRINHAVGQSLYAHMSRFAGLAAGAAVKAGQTIGYVGSTGNSTGPHLHFERIGAAFKSIFAGVSSSGSADGVSAFDPVGKLKELVGGQLKKISDRFGGGPIASAVAALPKMLLSSLVKKVTGLAGASVDPGGTGVERWAPTVTAALNRVGLPGSLHDNWMRQIKSESGGNPSITQQVRDVNSGGNEAQGLVQVIPGTFAAYRDPSLPNDRRNPLANLVAGMRYAKARYGVSGMERVIGAGHGYWRGTRSSLAGPARLAERGPELVVGPTVGTLSAGSTVLDAEDTAALFGRGGGDVTNIYAPDDRVTEWIRLNEREKRRRQLVGV